MLLPTLGILGIALVAAPLQLHRLYQLVAATEKRQIAIDNTADFLGKEESRLLNHVERVNQRLADLEQVHHGVHVCARTPGPSMPACVTEDLAMEANIHLLVQTEIAHSHSKWSSLAARARSRLITDWLQGKIEGRSVTAPITPILCPICRLPARLKLPDSMNWVHLQSTVNGRESVRYRLEKLSSKKGWNYRLRPEAEGADAK